MTVLSAELKVYKSSVVGAGTTNGGRISSVLSRSGVPNNDWPDVLKTDRLAGLQLLRKIFLKVANDSDESFLASYIWHDILTTGDDYTVFWPGTQRDTQADITGSERIYGCASLNTALSAGDAEIIVDVEDSTLTGMFADGDKVRVSDMATPNSTTGNEEIVTIDGTPTVDGTKVTFSIDETVANDYATAGTRVASLYYPGTVACSVDNWVETAAGDGTYDETTYPVVCDNIGTIEETITATKVSGGWAVSSDFAGPDGTWSTNLGTWNGTSDFAPIHPGFTKPRFTLKAAGIEGTWVENDTIVFQLHPAAVPIWQKRIVPVACDSLLNNNNRICWSGESV